MRAPCLGVRAWATTSQLHISSIEADTVSVKYLIAAAVALAGCAPTLSAGINTNTSMSGPIKNLVTEPVATARSETAPPVDNTRSFSFAAGTKMDRFGVEFGLHLHDVKGASFE